MIGRRCWTRTETRCLGSGGTRIASSRYSTWSDPIECAVFALDIASNQNLFYVLDVLVYLKYAIYGVQMHLARFSCKYEKFYVQYIHMYEVIA